jgi:uncharacterized repeat protein (TIGR01451 family)
MMWFHRVLPHQGLARRVVVVGFGALLLLPAPVVRAQQQDGQNQQGQGGQNQQGQPVLAVTVSGPRQADFGAPVAYTISLSNVGDSPATGVLLQITYAPMLHLQIGGLKCVAVPGVRFALPNLDCSGALPAGATATVTLAGTAPTYTSVIGLIAVADPRNHFSNGNVAGKTAQIATVVATLLPDLVADASGVPVVIQAGAIFRSSIDVRNIGTAGASGITLVDTLPAGSSFVSATGAAGFTCVGPGETVTCSGGSLAAGADALLQIDARAPLNAGAATTTIVVDPGNALRELNKNNNATTKSLTVVAGLADLTIAFAAVPGVVPVGAPFTVTLSVGNIGTATASSVSFVDRFTRVALDSYTASNDLTCQTTAFKGKGGAVGALSGVACNGGTVAPGETATVTLSLIADILPQTWTQQAEVNQTGAINESNTNNNSATSTVVFQ